MAFPGRGNLAFAIQNNQTTSLDVSEFAISSGQASDNHPATFQFNQGSGQTDTIRAVLAGQLREQALFAIRRNLHNSCARSLLIGTIIEIADENVAFDQMPNALLNHRDPIGINVAIPWNSGGYFIHIGKLIEIKS